MQQRAAIDARTEFLPQRIDVARNPFVTLRPVNPRRKITAVFYFCSERAEAGPRIRKVMQHANRKNVIKRPPEGQMLNVGLNDVSIFQITRCRKGGFDRIAQINAYHIACAPACR